MILAGAAVAFITGVVAGSGIALSTWIELGLAACLLAAAWPLRRVGAWRFAVIGAALCLGVWRAPHSSPPGPGDLSYYNGRSVTVSGIVSAEPDIRDTGANYQISISGMTRPAVHVGVAGGVYLHTSSAVRLEYGDQVTLTGRLLGTGSGGFTDYLSRQGIHSEMKYPRVVDQGPTSSTGRVQAALLHLRQRLEAGIDAWLPEPEASLLIAIALGARSSQLGDLAPILVSTGLIHLIAISGIKVALVAGMIQQAIRSFAGRLLAYAGGMATIWTYVLLTGFTASGVRSAGMWSLVFIAGVLGRQTVALLSLLMVAAIMVTADPSLPWDIGFQMSTLGTLSIVAFTDRLDALIPRLGSRRENPADPGLRKQGLVLLPSPFREAFVVTVAAQAGTVPVVISGFHVLSAVGPLANTLALPFLPLLILLGFVLGAISGAGALAAPVAGLTYVLLHLIIAAARSLNAIGGATKLSALSGPAIAAYYAVLFVVAYVVLRRAGFAPPARYRGQARELTVAGGLGLALLSWSLMNAHASGGTTLTWLGSSNSMLLQSGGMSVLIDGSNHPFVLLERLGSLLPYDRHKIDVVAVTDPRSANVSGLQTVMQHYRIGEVLDVGVEYPSGTYARWRGLLRAARIPVYALRTGVSMPLGDSRMTVLGPDAVYPKPQDSAGILRLALPGKTFLLALAADVREQHEALFRGIRMRADALLVGQKTDPGFVQAVLGPTGEPVGGLAPSTVTLYPGSG